MKEIIKHSTNELSLLSDSFMKSGFFSDIKSSAQAFVKIQAGIELGIPPFAAISGIHIISGKVAIGAGIMASCIKASNKYNYEVIDLSDKSCSIDFLQGNKKLGNSTFTIDDAKKAGTKNLEKFPRNMLFARAISNGVRWFCPDIFSAPVYTPEELNTIDINNEEVNNIYITKKEIVNSEQTTLIKQELNGGHEFWKDAVQYVSQKGKLGIKTIRKKYELSQDNEELLISEAMNLV